MERPTNCPECGNEMTIARMTSLDTNDPPQMLWSCKHIAEDGKTNYAVYHREVVKQ